MQLTFLGTGTSGGVPSIGCHCPVCTSSDPRDRRLRSSALIESANTRILIDCGPDFRQQILPFVFKPFDGVLLTHIHYDHVAGIDDMRPFCVFGPVHLYANQATVKALHATMPYCFAEHLYPGVPKLQLHEIAPHEPFSIGDFKVTPIQVMHGKMPILGFLFDGLAYITDMKTIDDEDAALLMGVDTLVVNALRQNKEHYSHQLLNDAVNLARRVGARRTFIIHACHDIGLHKQVDDMLPPDIRMAYDGMVIKWE